MNARNGNEHPAEQPGQPEQSGEAGTRDHGLVRVLKSVHIRPEVGSAVDSRQVNPRFYGSFNYALLTPDSGSLSLAVGITSANPGEGKTLVTANLAVSLAIANRRDTIIVDLDVASPMQHGIFGIRQTPGLMEALDGPDIQVYRTQVDHLFVLPAGDIRARTRLMEGLAEPELGTASAGYSASIGLEQLVALRNVLYSLKREFEFVLVDMPELREPRIPTLLSQEMDGLLVVIDTRRTTHDDMEMLFRRVSKKHVIGFVLNRTPEHGV